MKLSSEVRLIIFLTILATSIIVIKTTPKVIGHYNKKYSFGRYVNLIKKTYKWELQEANNLLKPAAFNEAGIDEIALVTMIKDEEDIIYENLVWHFCVGFRKFVIVDNESKDNTRMLINKFKSEVGEKAQVIIIDDPIVEHIQSPFITSSMKLAHHIWPTVKWVFPVDGDEFWYPTRKLDDILQNIPGEKNAIQTLQYNYFPTEKSEKFDDKIPFYKSIRCRIKFKPEQPYESLIGKSVTKPGSNIVIAQGNHVVFKEKDATYTNYVSGNVIGLNMLHFQRRSVAQVQKKYSNGAIANSLGQKKGRIHQLEGMHWTSFTSEIENKGLYQAAKDRFDEYVVEKDNCIDAPLPMDNAFKLFHEIIGNQDKADAN